MNYDIINSFYKEITKKLGNDYKIVLEPSSKLEDTFIEKDSIEWTIEDILKDEVERLKNSNLSLEEKILELYRYICLNYVYDDNVLFFFKMDKTDKDNIKYIAVDFYGRIIDNKWVVNRKKHNRRICYEFSRFFAKAINIFIAGKENMEAFILGLSDNTHYITVVSGDKYSAILDLDDFNRIKDLTRLKLGLTLEGITILRDNNILKPALDKFNIGRKEELEEVIKLKEIYIKDNDLINYLKAVIKELKKYNLDAQGFQEYIRKIIEDVDFKVDKIWKKATDNPEKRYVRCLVFEYKNSKYLVDSIEQKITNYNEESLDKNIFVIDSEKHYYDYYGS